jgi:hypothetical protein
MIRVILDGTVIKTRLDRKATNISVLAAIGVRRDGQKVLLSIMNMGGESTAAWRQFLARLTDVERPARQRNADPLHRYSFHGQLSALSWPSYFFRASPSGGHSAR